MQTDQTVKDALVKCAVGLTAGEVVEEYSADSSGELKLTKRKVTKRDIPPDIKAVKMIMDGGDLEGASDEELLKERERLVNMLKEE